MCYNCNFNECKIGEGSLNVPKKYLNPNRVSFSSVLLILHVELTLKLKIIADHMLYNIMLFYYTNRYFGEHIFDRLVMNNNPGLL